MADKTISPASESTALNPDISSAERERSERIFLCVVDNTDECHNAIYFAARRTLRASGRIALLYIMEPAEFQHWMSVEEKMREEAREEAEGVLQQYASKVQEWTGDLPALYVREGKAAATILGLIEEDQRISVLVLGAGVDKKGPGPLVSYIGGKMSGKFPIPIMIIPGNLNQHQIDMLT